MPLPIGGGWRRLGAPGRVLGLIVVLAALAAVGALAAARLPDARPEPSWPELVAWTIALIVGGSFSITYHYRGQSDSLDHFEVVLAPALFFVPGHQVIAMVAVAKALSQLRQRVDPVKAVFNVAQWTVAAAAGSVIVIALRPAGDGPAADLLPLVLAMVVVALVNGYSVAVVLRLLGNPRPRSWVGQPIAALFRSTALPWAASVSLGLLAVCTLAWAPWATPLLMVPLATLHRAARGYATEREQHGRLYALQRATAALATPTNPRFGLPGFVEEIGRNLDWERVELVLVGRSGPTLYVWPDEESAQRPVPRASRLTGVVVAAERPLYADTRTGEPWLRDMLNADGWREGLAASITVGPRTVGALCLYNRRNATALPEKELQLVQDLAREVATAVEKAGLIEAIDEERAHLAQIVTEATDGIATVGVDGLVTSWNPAFERLTGYAREAVLGSRGLDVLHPADRSGQPVDWRAWAEEEQDPPTDVEVRTPEGARRHLSCSYAHGLDEHGRPDRLIVMARDVTELRRAEAVLAGQAGIFELIAQGAPLSETLHTLATTLTSLTDATACLVLVASPDGMQRLRPIAAVGPGSAAVAAAVDGHMGGHGGWVDDLADLRVETEAGVDTDQRWQWLCQATPAQKFRTCQTVPIRAAAGGRAVGAVLLLSAEQPRPDWGVGTEQLVRTADLAAIAIERSESEERLVHQATHDHLTGLPNRLVFLDRCEQALHQTRRSDDHVVVLFVDLDRFKLINDSLGHDTGDQLLVGVGQRFQEALRPADTVARFGGDEFAILCDGITDERHMVMVAERVRSVLAAPFRLNGGDIFVTVSVGIVLSSGGDHAAGVLENADSAMYRAKQAGGNRWEIFDEAMRVRATLSLSTQNDLHRALQRDELVLHYQPIVCLRTGGVIGVEALLRWQHPHRGLLGPDAFLRLAESTGLIVPIGERVIDLACKQADAWRGSGPGGRPLRMAINLSARQFGQPNLAGTVAGALEDSAVDPATISLEITESVLMEDSRASEAIMHQLKALGVRLSIDDFGTGYSSLAYLQRFPVDELKVDRSFVTDFTAMADDTTIVAAIVNLAHSLNLTAVAEGVETVNQLERLRQLDCDVAQGFYFGRAQPFDQLQTALQK